MPANNAIYNKRLFMLLIFFKSKNSQLVIPILMWCEKSFLQHGLIMFDASIHAPKNKRLDEEKTHSIDRKCCPPAAQNDAFRH
jgi:hypothetical protein